MAELGGKIYVVGGFGGERELEIYDSAADRPTPCGWQPPALSSTARPAPSAQEPLRVLDVSGAEPS